MTNASFKALKEKVGVDDIAYSLGYRLKREAGVGKYIEMALPDGRGGNSDTLVISNPKSKVSQLYFHRSGAKGGDVSRLDHGEYQQFFRIWEGQMGKSPEGDGKICQ